ncbi:MAG: RpiB/LacA/LacB family sugar-phosphate isomerase [Candidatus Paceibacterota bacterium]
MIYIGSDHAGYELKEKLKIFLAELSYKVIDKGAFKKNSDDDYPDFVIPVAESVAQDLGSFGIVIGGSGQGEAMSANKIDGVRATEYYGGDPEIVKVSRLHNDANILSLGARFVSEEEAREVVTLFLETKFSGEERHIRRLNEIKEEEINN